jgi:Flp pilus assembly protein TadD
MTDQVHKQARRTWRRQFVRLYVIAFIVTLIPFAFSRIATQVEANSASESAQQALVHGQLVDAISNADAMLERTPSSERAQAIRMNALIERYWETKSAADLSEARTAGKRLQPSRDSQALVARGNLALVDNDPKRAVTLMSDAIAVDPKDAYAHHQLGFALNQAGRPEEALTHFKQALGLAPKMAWVQQNLADLLTKLGRCDEQIEGMIPEANAECHGQIGVKVFNEGQVMEGRRHFERAVQLAPNVGAFHANLAFALLQTGDRASAIQHATRAKALGVTDHPVFNALGIR